MEIAFEAARAVSILAFFVYGVHCIGSASMRAEFERYGLGSLRVLTGALEIAGAAGLLAGCWWPPITVAAAAGLTLLMALGTWTRIRIRDPLPAMLPAMLFCLLNAFIATYALMAGG